VAEPQSAAGFDAEPAGLMAGDASLLLVDDRPENLDVLEALLARPGLRLLRAGSGRDALELLLEHDVALALLDVHMPEMDGFELAELMRGTERTRAVPIIFVTAATPAIDRIFRGYEAGAVDFLFKPINPHLLQSKVNVFIELFRHRQQLARQVEELKTLTRTAELLIGVLSHDLRAPLGAILMAADVLARVHSGDEHTLQITARIRSSSTRMARLIEQLLDFAHARVGGSLPVKPAQIDLEELCHVALFEFEHSRERLRLAVDGDTRGTWDADRLLQVISNLVGNALQHGETGDPVDVAIDGSTPQSVTIRVTNGGTIPDERRTELFSPFSPPAGATHGTGLGLYIVDTIVRAHGGVVAAESRNGQTTFSVEMPRHMSEVPGPPAR
jgi:two-component system sensor histidine kinase/response regulator